MNKKDIVDTIRRYLENKEEVKAAYLFGSVVSGKASRESDVDIALLTGPLKDKWDSFSSRLCYQTELSKLLKKDVDVILLQEAGEILSFQILKKGQLIFESDRQGTRSFIATRLIQCLDFKHHEAIMQKGMVSALRRQVVGR